MKSLNRDEVVRCLVAAAHALEGASHIVMIGMDASGLYEQARQLIHEVEGYGKEHISEPAVCPHATSILVNGRVSRILRGLLTYDEIIALAYDEHYDGDVLYTVTYRRGRHEAGTVLKDSGLRVSDDLVIDVAQTSNA